jgi:hypothetical protein
VCFLARILTAAVKPLHERPWFGARYEFGAHQALRLSTAWA